MSNFQHSNVLFCDNRGCMLEFNVRNTFDKERLKAMITRGGGFCTQSEEAIHLVNPGARVTFRDKGKILVSSRYIYDCVKENCLLEVDNYRKVVTESEVSDMSDDEKEPVPSKKPLLNITPFKQSLNCGEEEDPIDLTEENNDKNLKETRKESVLDFSLPIISPETMKELNNSKTSSESFIESSLRLSVNPKSVLADCANEPLTSTAKEPNVYITDNRELDGISPIQASQSIVYPESNVSNQKVEQAHLLNKNIGKDVTVETIVSSSQEFLGSLDHFDNLLLHKIQQKPEEELHLDSEEQSSQSYTVSSSADPPISPKSSSIESRTYEVLAARAEAACSAPDSLCSSLHQDRIAYIKKLECEVEKILLKPSPKSIQDKTSLVKYICCVKKVPPSKVFEYLQIL